MKKAEKQSIREMPELCPDCGVRPGELQKDECIVQRCPVCSDLRSNCDEERPITRKYLDTIYGKCGSWDNFPEEHWRPITITMPDDKRE